MQNCITPRKVKSKIWLLFQVSFVLVHGDGVKYVIRACTYISNYLFGSTTFYHERYDNLKKWMHNNIMLLVLVEKLHYPLGNIKGASSI